MNGCVVVTYRSGNDIFTSLSAHCRSCTALLLLSSLGTRIRSTRLVQHERRMRRKGWDVYGMKGGEPCLIIRLRQCTLVLSDIKNNVIGDEGEMV